MTMSLSLAERVLGRLAVVAETDDVRTDLELPLYADHVLDSMKTVELIVALAEEFGLDISPAELEADTWATPARLIAWIEERVPA